MYKKIDNNNLIAFSLIIILLKLFFVFMHNAGEHLLAYGWDASVYDNYAKNGAGISLTLWMDFLAFLYSVGLYSRLGITLLIQFISIIILPLLFARFIYFHTESTKSGLLGFILISLYASLYIYSGDIYRDVVMLLLFFIAIYFSYLTIYVKGFSLIIWMCFLLLSSYILFGFRPYLGFSFIVAYFLSNFKQSENVKPLIFIYLILVLVATQFGLFAPLFEYRTAFDSDGGGSTMGISLESASFTSVIPLFLLSYLGQFLGLFITSPISLVFFLIESMPVIYFLKQINYKLVLSERFTRFLLYFVILYNTIWVLANDNLGTATRLRMFSYIVICFLFFVSKRKNIQK
jgi:hypothetical protein